MNENSQLTKEEVLRIAKLAHVEVSKGEAEALRADLSVILAFVQKLEELPVEGVSPTSHIGGIPAALRADEARIEEDRDKARIEGMMKQFPSRKGNYLRVPHVFQDKNV